MLRLKKIGLQALALALVLTFMAEQSRCDVIGSTYSVGGTIWDVDQDGGFFVGPGTTNVTFDNTSKAIGALAFGNAGDQIFIEESQTLAADGITFTVSVNMVARDAAGALTTWVAPGVVFDDDGDGGATPEVPFFISFFNLGQSNGGTDALEVNTAGGIYTFVSSDTPLLGVNGANFTFGGGPTDPSGPSGLFNATVGFNNGAELGAAGPSLGGELVAGYGFSWTYTLEAVPEPGSASLLLLVGLAGLARRRR